jgi:hypothetical protein
MEAVERALVSFKYSKIKKCLFSCSKKFITRDDSSKVFMGKLLNIHKGIEPELLIWENFGISKFSRLLRTIIYIIFVLSMLTFCFYIIFLLENASNNA